MRYRVQREGSILASSKVSNTTYGCVEGGPIFRDKGAAKCSDLVTVEVDTRYEEEFEVDGKPFEQVIALVGRHSSTDHCQVPPEVLDLA